MFPEEQLFCIEWDCCVEQCTVNALIISIVSLPIRFFLIIIIITLKGSQCKAGRERLTPYLSEDPSPTIPTYRKEKEKRETIEDQK